MIENIHEHDGQHAGFPREVTKGFSERVTGYAARNFYALGGGADDTPRLHPADGPFVFAVADKNERAPAVRKQQPERVYSLFIQCDCFSFPRFLFRDNDMRPEVPALKVINVLPCGAQ